MRSTRLVCVLLLVLAATASAQVPRTINFQGRVRDAAGVYLDGTRSCTLRIYDQPTGGTALFTEINPTDFDKGTFTITIGSRTTGGIPEAVNFDKQYWLGVTIDNFNNGQEIAPRMRMSASPYALHSTLANAALHAETAGHAESAESAKSLDAPASITGSAFGAQPVLEVINQEGSIGLKVHGNDYAIVSMGVDSTSRHYVAGENADGNTPAPGGFYRDNAPIAWALIDSEGKVISGFGIAEVTHGTGGAYTVTLANNAEIETESKLPKLAPMVQPSGLTGSGFNGLMGNWFFRPGNARDIFVRLQTIQGEGINSAFSIIVFGTPE